MPILIFLAVSYTGVLVAVVADLLTGILRARRSRTPLTSRGYRRTVDKIRSYIGALLGLTLVDAIIISALVAHRACGGCSPVVPFPYLTSAGAIGLCLIEVKSMMENSERCLDFKRVADLAKRLFSLLKG